MDRISAIRNVEEALRDFESGEADLAATEQRVVTVLRTYATEFEDADRPDLDAYRAGGGGVADGIVVVAGSPEEARDRIGRLIEDPEAEFDVESL